MQPFVRPRLSYQAIASRLRQEVRPSRLIPSLTAALVTGVIEIIYCISFAPLIFSGELAPYLTTGIGLTLFTSMTVNFVIALASPFAGMLGGIQDAPTILLGVTAAPVAARFSAAAPQQAVLPTLIVTLAFTSVLTGLCCFLLGRFKLANLVRFIPYPVVGGFLAGTSWLVAVGSLGFMTDLSLSLAELPQLLQPQALLQWLPGACFAILLLVLLRRYDHFLLIPGLVASAILLFYTVLFVTRTSIAQAQAFGLLLASLPSGHLWHPLPVSTLAQADWSLILSQLGQIGAVILVTVISILLNITSTELAIERDLDLNRELQGAGIANLASGLGGGILGYHSMSSVILSYGKLGAKSRLVGLLVALEIAIVLFAGASVITLFPKFILGGITLWLGLDLLLEWVYNSWFKLPKTDYCIVILILTVIVAVDFLKGVAVGLAAAIVLFIVNYSRVNIAKHTLSGAAYQSHAARTLPQARLLQEEGDRIYILSLQGFLFFGTANKLLDRIQQRLQDVNLLPLRFVILNFQSVHGIDSSAVLSFVKLKQQVQPQEIKLVFTHLSATAQSQLRQGGCLKDDDPICRVFPDLDRGLEWCENELLVEVPFRRSRSLPLALQLNYFFPNRDDASEFVIYLEERDAEQGELIFQQQQPVDALYFIEVGQITVYLELQFGNTRRIQTLGAGNLVGELDFFRGTVHQTSAVVDAPSTLYRLSTAGFQQMQQEKPDVAAAFQLAVIQILGDRLSSAYKEIADLLDF